MLLAGNGGGSLPVQSGVTVCVLMCFLAVCLLLLLSFPGRQTFLMSHEPEEEIFDAGKHTSF